MSVSAQIALVDQLLAYGIELQAKSPSNGFLPLLRDAIDQLQSLTLLVERVRQEVGTDRLEALIAEVNEALTDAMGADAPQLVIERGEAPR